MRIAMFTELYLPSVGGQEIRFAEMAETLARHGHSLDVFCVNNIKGAPRDEKFGSVSVHRYPVAEDYRSPKLRAFRRRPTVILRYAWWCRREAARGFDAYIYNQWPLLHVLFAPRRVRRNAITDWCELRSGRVFGIIQKFLPRSSGRNMAVSPAVKEHLEQVSKRPFAFVPSGINVARYRSLPRAQRKGLLYLGRITEHKNLELLVDAFEQMRATGYQGHLSIAGSGPGVEHLQERCRRSVCREHIELLGFVTEEQKIDLLSQAELLVIPSRREGFPRVVAEAMASGLPTVTVDFADNGTRDVVRHYGAGLVTRAEAPQLASGMKEALEHWDEFSAAARSASGSLDWEVVVEKVIDLASSGGERA